MKIPLSWLKEYVDFDLSPEELAEKLTFAGHEVERIEVLGAAFENVVVGEVKEVCPHPAADRLLLCVVSDGAEDLHVVCGASNFKVGDRVPLARVGARLPDGTKIKKSKIRGEYSFGMMCAGDELGISDDHAGIIILPADAEPGRPAADYICPPETVLHFEITWNRGDCLSMIGMAREVAAVLGSELRVPGAEVEDVGGDDVAVEIEDKSACPRYVARILSGVAVGPSPAWMQSRLAACGVRAINNVVDVTNYVMLECGQPLHAFDVDKLADPKIFVRKSKAGEKIVTLDQKERNLDEGVLVIADQRRPVAVAGVMGGAESEIGDASTRVLLESACFDPAEVHASSSRLGLSSESSHRFERGVDVMNVAWAGRRAAGLLAEICGAKAGPESDVFPGRSKPVSVSCSYDRVRETLGVHVEDSSIVSALRGLGMKVREKENGCEVESPTFRSDIEIEADLIEEVSRLYGLDRVPSPAPCARVVPTADDSRWRLVSTCRWHLAGLGLSEIMNYSFVSADLLDWVECDRPTDRLVLPNPVSRDHAVMRPALIPQMLETLGRNYSRQEKNARLFEIGRVFSRDESGRNKEEERISLGLMGFAEDRGVERVDSVDPGDMFLWLKGILGALCAANKAQFTLSPAGAPFLEPGLAFDLAVNGAQCGLAGIVAGRVADKWKIAGPVAVAELALEPILLKALEPLIVSSVPAFPAVERDVALVVPVGITNQQVLNIVRKNAPRELTEVRLFDIYTGSRVEEGKKSMAYSLVYRSGKRTLTDEEANEYHEKVKRALEDELGAQIREG